MNNTPDKISVLIPTYRRPQECLSAVCNLFGMAAHPHRSSLEFVLIVSEGDPDMNVYLKMQRDLSDMGITVVLLRSVKTGYDSIKYFYDLGYAHSTGHLLLAFNDDAHVLTLGWDDAYRRALAVVSFGVASSDVHESADYSVTGYSWAFPMVRRDLCDAIGGFCICTPRGSVDRVCDAYAQINPSRAVKVPVSFWHSWPKPEGESERSGWYNWVNDPVNWEACLVAWKADAQKMTGLVQHVSL